MKHAIFIVAVSIAGFGIVGAQDGVGLRYYVNTGMTFPSSPEVFSRYWNPGFNLGGGVGYQTSQGLVLQAYVDLNNSPVDKRKFLADAGLSSSGIVMTGGSASMLTISTNVKSNLPPAGARISPYLVVGAGYLRLSTAAANISDQELSEEVEGKSETAVSIGLGAGFDIKLNDRLTLFLEGKHSIGFTDEDNTQYFPLKVGIAFR